MRTLQKLLAFSLFFFFLLSSCAPPTPLAPATQTPPPAATETPSAAQTPAETVSRLKVEKEALRGVQVTVWHPWFGAEASLFDLQVAQFNAVNEWGIVVRAEGKGNFSELFAQTDAALRNGALPSMAVALPEHALAWRETVTDLNPYLRDPDYGMSALEMSEFPTVVWMQDEADGVRLGMPAQRTGRFILYNQTWARELGFFSPPETSLEFEEQACAANKALAGDADPNNDALGGWLIDTHAMTPLGWLFAFGGGVQEGEGYRFVSPENVEAFKFLKALQRKGCAWVPSPALTAPQRFAGRQALFVSASLEEFAEYARAFGALGGRDEWVVLPFPGPEGGAFAVYGSSFVVFESDEATQLAAWLFIRWMLGAETQARWVQSTGLLPLRASTLSLLAGYEAEHPQWAQAVTLLPAGRMTPKLASWRVVRVVLADGFSDMFDTIRHPDWTEEQAPAVLKQMEDTANELNR
ncbi:MAG: extracellular solute-binding protein [Chloroflexota bacterium]|jgi:sn-glycerol 3-phosphate transport system substrate-binding protein